MLGVRLESSLERELGNYAREIGRTKSDVVRELILKHLEKESVDEGMRHACRILAENDDPQDYIDIDWGHHD